jgi:hypothetical protein
VSISLILSNGADVYRVEVLLFDGVGECADAIDRDLNFVVRGKREGIRWNDAGSGEKKASVREALIAEEVLDQCRRITFQFG